MRNVSCIHQDPNPSSCRWVCVSRTCPCCASCGHSTSPSRSTRAAARTWAPPPASAWWRTATSTRTMSITQSLAPLPPGNSQTERSETGRHQWPQPRTAAAKTTAGTPFTSPSEGSLSALCTRKCIILEVKDFVLRWRKSWKPSCLSGRTGWVETAVDWYLITIIDYTKFQLIFDSSSGETHPCLCCRRFCFYWVFLQRKPGASDCGAEKARCSDNTCSNSGVEMDCILRLRILKIRQYIYDFFFFYKQLCCCFYIKWVLLASLPFWQNIFFFTYTKYMNKVVLFII